jgi:hypothetical protein
MIDAAAITTRFNALSPFLDERERRLFSASKARAGTRRGGSAGRRKRISAPPSPLANHTPSGDIQGRKGGKYKTGGPP